MASVSAADVRDTLNLTPADIPDSKVTKMIKRAEVTLELELEKQIRNVVRKSSLPSEGVEIWEKMFEEDKKKEESSLDSSPMLSSF